MSVLSVFAPHRRAVGLIDLELDGALAREDAAWLEKHLSRCARCSVVADDRKRLVASMRALGTAKAPVGFAGRVLLAAKTRRHEEPEVDEARSPWFSQLAVGASFVVALAIGLAVLFAVGPSGVPHGGKGETAIGGNGLALADVPHFVVRAPTLGAAQARREIVKVVEAHGGSYSDSGQAIMARIPRARLVAVTQDLASRTAFRMAKADAGELPADLQMIVIRFELD